jgi:hypothetical protein
MLDDVKCVEENPERMRRICQPAVSKGVRGKQVAELIVNLGRRDWEPRQKRHTRKDGGRADGRYSKALVSREPGKLLLDPAQNQLTETRPGPDECQANRKNNPIQYLHGIHRRLMNRGYEGSQLMDHNQ